MNRIKVGMIVLPEDSNTPTKDDLQQQVSDIFNTLCSELGMREDLFFDIVDFLSVSSSKRTNAYYNGRKYAKLSFNTLKNYRSKKLSYKYVFKDHAALLRTIKRAVALYIGKDIEKIVVNLDDTIDERDAIIEQHGKCCELSKDEIRTVEKNWKEKKGEIELALFECFEAARMIEYPKSEMEKLQTKLDDISATLKLFERIVNESPDDLKNSLILYGDEHIALANTLREIPEIIDVIEKARDNVNNQHIEYVLAQPKGSY